MAERNNRGCLWAALLVFGLLVFAAVAFWWLVRSFEPPPVEVTRGSFLEVDLADVAGEAPAGDLGPFFSTPTYSLWELTRALAAATRDHRVAGIRLHIGGSGIGWAGAEDVLEQLDRVRAAGKPVYALVEADFLDDLDYFLATGAERIWVTPLAAAAVNGLAAEVQLYRGTLDKLHVEPEVFMYKEYKSAGEPLLNYEMSSYMRESLEAVLADTQARFVARVTERRGVTAAGLEQLLARGLAPADELVEAGLVDAVGYADEIDAALATAAEQGVYHGIGMRDYISSLPSRLPNRAQVALVFAEGPVVVTAPAPVLPFFASRVIAGERIAAAITEAADDPSVRAIVLRVNSPGGSAVGSDLVRRAIERAQEEGKTVVASFSDTAASGGYWIGMAADAIVAEPTTLTGSIGVVFTKLNLDGFFEWLGTHVERITSSPAADLLSSGPLDEVERAGVLAWMDAAYADFTGHVADGRSMAPEEVERIAKGRVWTGAAAVENGLVDRLGSLDDALRLAADRTGLEVDGEVPVKILPRPRTFWERVFRGDTSAAALARDGVLLEWARAAARPQVQARMPDIRIR